MNENLIMVVDDDASTRALLDERLRQQGFRVHSTAGALDALAYLETVETELPRIIVLDQQMPHMRGNEFLSELYARRPAFAHSVIVFLFSASTVVPLSARWVKNVMYLSKETDLEALVHMAASFRDRLPRKLSTGNVAA